MKIDNKILSKKKYVRPEIKRFEIDNSISLVMMTATPPNPPPRPRGGGQGKGNGNEVFESPFGDKPFN